MCEQCPSENQDYSRRNLLRWGVAVPVAAAAVAGPLAGVASADLSIETGGKRGSAFYVAKSGDTLRLIATRFLGNAERWTEILALNHRELGRDKEPKPGQRLVLPESPDGGGTRNFAPIPAGSKPLPVPPEGYRLDRIGDSAYGLIVGNTQSAFVVTGDGVVVLDAPAASATALPAAIKRITDKRVTHLIYSHSHSDHIGAASLFPDAVKVAHAETARTLIANRDPARPVPSLTFTDTHTLDVGGQQFVLSYPGPNHESGNIIIQVPGQKLVMLVDVAFAGWAPFRAFGTADSVPGVLRALREVLKLDFDTYVSGHFYRWGTKADVREANELVTDMWVETGKAIAATPSAEFFAKVEPGNSWAGVDLWFEAIAKKAEDPILKKWVTRLGAVDVFTKENLKIMTVAQRVDQPKDL